MILDLILWTGAMALIPGGIMILNLVAGAIWKFTRSGFQPAASIPRHKATRLLGSSPSCYASGPDQIATWPNVVILAVQVIAMAWSSIFWCVSFFT